MPIFPDRIGENRKTKIVCTMGPACRSLVTMSALIKAGMDVARLHCSYENQAEQVEYFKLVRHASKEADRKVTVLQDLSGTKIRMKEFAAKLVELKTGAEFTLTGQAIMGSESEVAINFPEIIPLIKTGDTILLADGALTLKAISATGTKVGCKVIEGGILKSGQAVHVPGKAVPLRVPTDKDRDDVLFGIQHGVDVIAMSYATSAAEVNELRAFLRQHGSTTPIIVKIERQAALRELDNLIAAADAVMVARGDLGLEIPIEEIAFVQKEIIHRAKAASKPVITATEMLFSMMEQPRPTRADVTDITNAILDGSDAVMLSGETGVGKYSVEAVTMMARIAENADRRLQAGWRAPGIGRPEYEMADEFRTVAEL